MILIGARGCPRESESVQVSGEGGNASEPGLPLPAHFRAEAPWRAGDIHYVNAAVLTARIT